MLRSHHIINVIFVMAQEQKGTTATRCVKCDGRGAVRVQQGFFTLQQTCPECRGSGETIKDPCLDCSGAEGREAIEPLR